MLRNRILATTAAFALATAQVTPGYALLPSPDVQTPDGTVASRAANAGFVSTAIANLQAYIVGLLGGKLSHVANATALAALTNTRLPVMRDDAAPATYVFVGAACGGTGTNGAADKGSCVNSTMSGVTGSWNLNWNSVGNVANLCLFEDCATATDFTAALQAAVATSKEVMIPDIGRSLNITADIVVQTTGQIIRGQGRTRSRIRVASNGGFTKGVFVVASGEPGPIFKDFSVTFIQPVDTTNYVSLVSYVPAFWIESQPRVTFARMGCYVATVCVDAIGNAGGMTSDDFQMSAFKNGVILDGSVDTIRLRNTHGFPFKMSANQTALANNNVVWIKSGRVDDFKETGGLFYKGTVFSFVPATVYDTTVTTTSGSPNVVVTGARTGLYTGMVMTAPGIPDRTIISSVSGQNVVLSKSATASASNVSATYTWTGQTGGSISDTDFDTALRGINISAGTITLTGGYAALGDPNSTMLLQSGGTLLMNNFVLASNNGGASSSIPQLSVSGGRFSFTGCYVHSHVDQPILQVSGSATAMFGSNVINQESIGGSFSNARIVLSGGPSSITNNVISNFVPSGSTGTFVNVTTDGRNIVTGNLLPGWSNTVAGAAMGDSLTPTSAGGKYFGNN